MTHSRRRQSRLIDTGTRLLEVGRYKRVGMILVNELFESGAMIEGPSRLVVVERAAREQERQLRVGGAGRSCDESQRRAFANLARA